MTFVDQDNQLILNDQVEKLIHEKLVADSLVSTYYEFLIFNADSILKSPLLERRISSGNMLRTSWEGMRRLTTLALVFRVSHDNKYLRRLEDEIEKIVDFSDWHPNHFLDVGEMSLGVALALNWCGQYFDENLRKKIKEKLRYHVDLTFKPGPGSGWLSKGNNWNQVCQAGIVGAALAVNDSSFVKKVVSRGVGNLSQSMKSYAPEGAFLEGPVYWGYGTVFTAFLVSMLESRFDHDFGLSKYPGFFESAAYRLMMNGTSGRVFNYSDTDPSGFGLSSREVFFFFALKTGDSLFLNKKEVLSLVKQDLRSGRASSRYAPIAFLWLVQFEPKGSSELPVLWVAKGENSVGVIKDSVFYLGVKGGKASLPHGHMDAGSFVFETKGIRWSIDMGNQSYFKASSVSKIDQWNYEQSSTRWDVLSKSNYGHSTITINGSKHSATGNGVVEGRFLSESIPSISADMTNVLAEDVNLALRYFVKLGPKKLVIKDSVEFRKSEYEFRWQMMVDAEVEVKGNEAILKKGGQQLNVRILSPDNVVFDVVNLNPPPHTYDKAMKGLKRLEINISADRLGKNKNLECLVELISI